MRVAIVGSGVSGLVAAHHLHEENDVTLFEAAGRLGGHVSTVSVEEGGENLEIDTGFIVFNPRTYPEFMGLLGSLGVAYQPTTMSFSVRNQRTGVEYNGTSLDTLFAQRRNLLRPSFLGMIRDILRFHRWVPGRIDGLSPTLNLGDFLADFQSGAAFKRDYLVPMGAAIWSTAPGRVLDFPARSFLRFLDNHGLLSVKDRPVWQVVEGGSRTYVERLVAPFRSRVRLSSPVVRVRRSSDHVAVTVAGGEPERFDRVVLATHSDQALGLLDEPTAAERSILGAIRYAENDTVLHTDTSLLPTSRRAWAAWNVHLPESEPERIPVTYWMNRLQNLTADRQYLVTLNRSDEIDPATIITRQRFHHPQFDGPATRAQERRGEISGHNRTHYCGAYWFNGFHEDGVRSGLAVVKELEG